MVCWGLQRPCPAAGGPSPFYLSAQPPRDSAWDILAEVGEGAASGPELALDTKASAIATAAQARHGLLQGASGSSHLQVGF